MEENKCCANGKHSGKCCGLKFIGVLVLLAIAFYVGTVVGPLEFMSKNSPNEQQENKTVSGSVTVNVLPSTDNTNTNNPPVLE